MLYRILILLILLLSAPAWGATYAPTTHAEMVTAVSALANGDTITISGSWVSSVYYNVTADNVTINSSSASNTISAGDDDTCVFNMGGSGQTITGFRIDGKKSTVASTIGIDIGGSGNTVSNMEIVDAFYYAIRVGAFSTGHTITGCTLANTGGTGINKAVYGNEIRVNPSGGADISNCVLTNNGSGSDLIVINGAAADGTISGCTLSGGTAGVTIYDTNGWTVSDNTITNVGSVAATDAVGLSSCEACNVLRNTVTQSADIGHAVWGVEITGGADVCDGTIISGNTFSGNYLNRCVAGGGSYIVVEENRCSAVEYGIAYENVDSSVFRYNLISMAGGTDEAAVFLHSNAAGERTVSVYNNTIINTDATTYGIRFEETTGTWGAAEVKNNIIQGFAKGLVIEDAGDDGIAVVHQYNNYYSNTANVQKDVAGLFSAESLGTGEITTDPLLNASDAGIAITGLHSGSNITGGDAAGNTWLYGDGIDIGAYEIWQGHFQNFFEFMQAFPKIYTVP